MSLKYGMKIDACGTPLMCGKAKEFYWVIIMQSGLDQDIYVKDTENEITVLGMWTFMPFEVKSLGSIRSHITVFLPLLFLVL